MFDGMGVSGRTARPWTVVVSFIGQLAAIGLAILLPLAGTQALPHRMIWVGLPGPPRGLPPRPAPAAAVRRGPVVPSQITRAGLVLPAWIPDKPAMLQDPAPDIGNVSGPGVPGGLADARGSGNGVIDGLLAAPVAAPAPPPPAVKAATLPPPVKRIRQGGLVEQGKLVSGPPPVYPPLARQARIEGTVVLEAVIARDGTILNLKAVSGHPLLVPAALSAVQKWVFRPTSLDGDPVEVSTQIQVRFTLR